MKNLQTYTTILLFLMAGLFSNNLTAQCMNNDPSDEGITPDLVEGNPNLCSGGTRIEPPASGTFNLDGISGNDVTITITDGPCGEVMSWSVPDHIVIDHVIAKGGSNANDYDYTGTGIQSDGNLHSPLAGGSGKYADFSHIDFCFHYRLSASKTANAEFTRTYTWTIDKSCDGDAELTLSEGQVYNYPFSWTVDATYEDTDFKVTGTITIENNTPFAASITSVSDVLSGGETGTVDCGISFPYLLAAGESLECTYSVDLAAPYDGTNTVTVETDGSNNVEGDEASADFWFGDPTTIMDGCIAVTDDCTSGSTEVCYDNTLPYTAEYTCPISYDVCGEYTYTNTASFTTSDTETEGSDHCTVSVNVPCGGGCTHTIGYWKTHSKYGPAPYDDTWEQVGEDAPFFLSGQSWYQVAWTNPAGNAYYILAHQYIAAHLNQLDGASIPPAVLTAYNTATTLFNTHTPAYIGGLKGGNPLRQQFIALAGILDAYNNGITGPGHCSEENSNGGKSAESRDAATTLSADFGLSPNPASDAVQIDLSNFVGQPVEIVLYNQLGAIVLNRHIANVDEAVFSLRFNKGLPSGVYNLTLVTATQKLNKSLVVSK